MTSQEHLEQVSLTDEQMLMLESLRVDNHYWSKAYDFIKNILGREVSSLREAQRNWYYVILASINREIDFSEARKAFSDEHDGSIKLKTSQTHKQ